MEFFIHSIYALKEEMILKMENKEIVTSQKIIERLIGYWLLWKIVFEIIYTIIFDLIADAVESGLFQLIIALALQGIIIFITWKLSTKIVFKKNTISYEDVPVVMKNLTIFTIIICIINCIYNFSNIDVKPDNNAYSSYIESMLSDIYNDTQMAEYQKQKEEAIKKSEIRTYTYLAIVEICLTAIYLVVLPLEKKEILKYVDLRG